MAASKLKRLWKNDFAQSAVIIALIIAIFLMLFFGTRLVFNAPYPTLTVETRRIL